MLSSTTIVYGTEKVRRYGTISGCSSELKYNDHPALKIRMHQTLYAQDVRNIVPFIMVVDRITILMKSDESEPVYWCSYSWIQTKLVYRL